jgi:hypothetical protein
MPGTKFPTIGHLAAPAMIRGTLDAVPHSNVPPHVSTQYDLDEEERSPEDHALQLVPCQTMDSQDENTRTLAGGPPISAEPSSLKTLLSTIAILASTWLPKRSSPPILVRVVTR